MSAGDERGNEHPAPPAHQTAEAAAASPKEPQNAPRCDLCGHAMRESHCKLICDQCGYIRDCSDP